MTDAEKRDIELQRKGALALMADLEKWGEHQAVAVAREHLDALFPPPEPPLTWVQGAVCSDFRGETFSAIEMVKRVGDMSPTDKLVIHQQEDGDIIVAVQTATNGFGDSVEFCTSGGRSQRTRVALRAVMDAMILDEAEAGR